MALTWDKALFDELYNAPCWRHGVRGVRHAPRFHYNWITQMPRMAMTVANLFAQPGWASVTNVAILGGGFGWMAELLQAQGVNVVVVDTGAYVQSQKGVSEEGDLRDYLTAQGFDPDNLDSQIQFMSPTDPNAVLGPGEIWNHWLKPGGSRSSLTIMDENLANAKSRNTVKNALPSTMDGILTEHLLDSMTTDAEALAVCASAQALRPNPACAVVHLLDVGTQGDPRLLNKTMADWRALLNANGYTNHYLVTPSGVIG